MLSFLRAYLKYDPATTSLLEVLFLYPGPKAIALHRVASALYRARVPFFPRLVAELGRWLTGIEIHPGARIGRRLVIDHGMGVVIGETAEVGDDCILYHGVTLGGTDLLRRKRHPTLGNRVVVGAGAKILGAIRIGDDSRIGANSVVISELPPRSTAVGIPARVLARGVSPGEELQHQAILGEEAPGRGEGGRSG